MGALLGVSRVIDAVNFRIGKLLSWLILVAVLVSAVNAVIRKVFDTSSNAWLELQWVLFGAVFLIVIAFRGVDVAAIAPFRYTLLIWAGICGYLAFGEVPDRFAMFGSALIVGSGLYALHREVVRRRTLAAAVPPAEPGA